MPGIQLAVGEAAALLGYSEDCIDALAAQRMLEVQGSGDERRISLQSLACYVGASADSVAVDGFRRVVEDPGAWNRVFGGNPHAASVHGPAGRTLRRALAISEIRRA